MSSSNPSSSSNRQPHQPHQQQHQHKAPGDYAGMPHFYGYSAAYGYGYDAYSDEAPNAQKNLRDYLSVLRERKWYIIISFILIVSAFAAYTFSATKLYTATASLEAKRGTGEIGRAAEEMNTQVAVLSSSEMIQRVASRFSEAERTEFMAPYENMLTIETAPSFQEILGRNRRVEPVRNSFIIAVSYTHPNNRVAAQVANLFVDEYISYNIEQRVRENLSANQALEEQARRQLDKVEEIKRRMIAMQEEAGTPAINQAANFEQTVLARMQGQKAESMSLLRDLETRWEQIEAFRAADRPLTELPFMNQLPRVAELQARLSSLEIDRSSLSQRYGPRHPTMIQLSEQMSAARRELAIALDSAVEKIRNEFDRATRNMEELERAIREQEARHLEISKLSVEYSSLNDELGVMRSIYANIVGSMRMTTLQGGLENPNARRLDRAADPLRPSSPRILVNMVAGIFGGLLVGVGLAFLVSFLDDRVKSSFDVERVVGIPLLGIIPRIKSTSRAQEKSKAVFNNIDHLATESFRTIYSALKINPEGKNAKAVLVTSTIPGEGKSFLASNLALTFAHNGHRTLLIDCDLRMPNVAKSLALTNQKGVITWFRGDSTLEESIQREPFPGLDVLTSGGQTRNPLPIINGEKFLGLLNELREHYDKIIIDTPPIAPVSDALNLVPHVDGVVYTMKFNLVKKRTAKLSVKRLVETNATLFGAVLNDVQSHGAGYYLYTDYYDKSFDKYYARQSRAEKKAAKEAEKAAAKGGAKEPAGTSAD